MNTSIDLAYLIKVRMGELGIKPAELGARLGYRNPAKAVGRVWALLNAFVDNDKNRRAVARLHEALEVAPEVVAAALAQNLARLAEEEQRRLDAKQKILEEYEARWRRDFRPHTILVAELNSPTQTRIWGYYGGPGRALHIDFIAIDDPNTFLRQTLEALPTKLTITPSGEPRTLFFGNAIGFVINYSPDHAVLHSLDGTPLETLSRARRYPDVPIRIGG